MNLFKKGSAFLIIIITLLLGCAVSKAQMNDTSSTSFAEIRDYVLYRNHDTNYISNFGEKVTVKLIGQSKYNYFRIWDTESGARLRFRPLRDVSIGVGVSYKWFALGLAVDLGLTDNTELENTKNFDIQAKAFGGKQIVSATLKYYKGYKLFGIQGFDDTFIPDSAKVREDLRTINIGLQYLYALNYTKFSLKAPFVLNEIQRKSSGSIIFGVSFNFYSMDADSSLVPPEVAEYIDPNLNLTDMNILTLSANFGYMYTFVVKERFFLTLSAIPGIGLHAGDYLSDERIYMTPKLNFNLASMNAIGYNSKRFFIGLQLIINSNFLRLGKDFGTEVGFGKGGVFMGYRFGGSK